MWNSSDKMLGFRCAAADLQLPLIAIAPLLCDGVAAGATALAMLANASVAIEKLQNTPRYSRWLRAQVPADG